MDFNDTPEEAAFRAEARAFLDAHAQRLAPGERLRPVELDVPAIAEAQRWQALKFDHGWAVLTWPREHGGRGARAIESVIWSQEESHYRVPSGQLFGIGLGMLGPTLMAHGSAEQKQRFLPKMARGEEIWCQLFSEPAAGSDLAGLRTSAVPDGDGWRINGQKIWTSGAHYCPWGMLVARTDPTRAKHDGLTYFIVDMKAPGVEIRPIRQINGASHFNEVFFNDVRVSDWYRVDRVNNGWRVALTTLMNERASLSGGGSGPGLRDLIRLARKVQIDGRPALEDSAVRQRIADFYVKGRGIQHTSNRALTALSRGQTPGPESSIGKLVLAPLGQQLAGFAVELQGMLGGEMEPEFGFQDSYLSSPGFRIAGGTDEIMRNIIAERVLRLPAEPRSDKGMAFKDIPTGRS
jgi:alkylation response protein AidB-like acyl-CoA dehydrogenase